MVQLPFPAVQYSDLHVLVNEGAITMQQAQAMMAEAAKSSGGRPNVSVRSDSLAGSKGDAGAEPSKSSNAEWSLTGAAGRRQRHKMKEAD